MGSPQSIQQHPCNQRLRPQNLCVYRRVVRGVRALQGCLDMIGRLCNGAVRQRGTSPGEVGGEYGRTRGALGFGRDLCRLRQSDREVHDGGEPRGRSLGHSTSEDVAHFLREPRSDARGGFGRELGHATQRFCQLAIRERLDAGHHLIGDDGERILVGVGADELEATGGLLRRHIVGRADELTHVREVPGRAESLADAEVEELHERRLSLGVDQEDVPGLQIAVDDSNPMRRRKPGGNLPADGNRLIERQGRLTPEAGVEVFAAQQLEDEIGFATLGNVEVEHGHHVRVLDPADDLRFLLEARDHLGARGVGCSDDLHGDATVQPQMLGLEHGAHRALVYPADDPVGLAENLPFDGRGPAGRSCASDNEVQ